MSDRDPKQLLPLKPVWLHILLTLAEEATHGYAIRKAVERRTDGTLRLWPATLYGALADLSEAGLIAESASERGSEDNLGRIRYELTDLGGRVLGLEADRLDALVRAARAAGASNPRTA